jgi:dUTP pyrophosphatase
MNDIRMLYKKTHKDAIEPTYAYPTDAGCDLYAIEEVVFEPGDIRLVGTGIAIQLPNNYVEAQIRSRSGMAVKHGMMVINSPATIDPEYRGELKVGLINLGKERYIIKVGDRMAQVVFNHFYKGNFMEATELEKSFRGTGGFGHTGK